MQGGKFGKVAALVAALGGGGGAAVGYGMTDKQTVRQEYTVDAKVGKVWDLLKDPENLPKWIPQDLLDIERVETLKPARESKIGAFFGGGEPPEGPSDPTHRIVLRDGRSIDVGAEYEDEKDVYRQTLVSRSAGENKFFTGFEWGYEVRESSEDRKKTRLVFIKRAKAKRPHGVILALFYRLTGKQQQNALSMVQSVERAVRD